MEQVTQISFDDTSVAFSAKSDKELKKMHYLFSAMNNNLLVDIGTYLMKVSLRLGIPVKRLIKNTVFGHFCGGETIQECETTIQELARYNIGTILDYSVEGATDEEGFERTTREILRTIEKAKGNARIPFSVFKITGLASSELLEKKQRGERLSDKQMKELDNVRSRVDRICKKAFESDVRVFIDGEESWLQDPIDEMVYEMMAKYNKKKAIVYNTFQMYRKDMLANFRRAFHYAVTYNYYLGAKLVRGAYMEKERKRAQEEGYEDPIQVDKAATDADYNRALLFCMDHKQRISLCSGSHNEYSNYYLTLLMNKHRLKINDERVYFAQLYGMSDNISFNLSHAGYNVAKYVPYGPIKAVMPYLFRRAEENTSISGQSSRELMLIESELKRRKRVKSMKSI